MTDIITAAKSRIIANACITRYNMGERPMESIVDYYNQPAEVKELIKAEILKWMPSIDFESVSVE